MASASFVPCSPKLTSRSPRAANKSPPSTPMLRSRRATVASSPSTQVRSSPSLGNRRLSSRTDYSSAVENALRQALQASAQTAVTATEASKSGGLMPTSTSAPVGAHSPKRTGDAHRFKLRHLPAKVERALKEPGLTHEMAQAFDALMQLLGENNPQSDMVKRVMAAQVDILVPEDSRILLRDAFERSCSFGERGNTEHMSSSTFLSFLRDIGVLGGSKVRRGSGQISSGEADCIFAKVIHTCEQGCKKLKYDLFCKALMIVACELAQWENSQVFSKFIELVSRVAVVKPDSDAFDKNSLQDASVQAALSQFKPRLLELFYAFAGQELDNPLDKSPGLGVIRNRERAAREHAEVICCDTIEATASLMDTSVTQNPASPTSEKRDVKAEVVAVPTPLRSIYFASKQEEQQGALSQSVQNKFDSFEAPTQECDGAGYPVAPMTPSIVGKYRSPRASPKASPRASPRNGSTSTVHAPLSGSSIGTGTIKSSPGLTRHRRASDCRLDAVSGTPLTDPYMYSNGIPVIADRKSHLPLAKLLQMNAKLGITPKYCTRTEIVNIFTSIRGSHDFFNPDNFLEAMVRIALRAFSKTPYAQMYPTSSRRINEFFSRVLPNKTLLQIRETFASERILA